MASLCIFAQLPAIQTKNGPAPASKSLIIISPVVLRDKAMGSRMHNAAELQEETAGGHEHPSKFCAVVTLHWHRAQRHSEGNFTPNRKSC